MEGMTGEGRHPDRVPMRDQPHTVPLQARGGEPRVLDPPVPVTVWLCGPGTGWRQLEGQATAWTPRTECVVYRDEHGRTDTAWLWASAIERR